VCLPHFTRVSYLGFAAFGIFWGMWGAILPALREQASLDDSQLGAALVFVGAGALPAMLLSGRAVDRLGPQVTGFALIGLGIAAALVGILAHDALSASLAMLLLGAASGAADVAINSLAGFAEQQSGTRVITRSHAVFSTLVVAGSLAAGALRSLGTPTPVIFASVATVIAAAGIAVAVILRAPPPIKTGSAPASRATAGVRWLMPFALVGLVGALAFAVENAHQSWGAVFLQQEIGATVGLTALAPATFAALSSVTRFVTSYARGLPPDGLLLGGAVIACGGTLLVAASQTVIVALAGLAVAAVGTSVLFPTLLSSATKDVSADRRGRATSAIGTIAYLGFLAGPAYVGFLAGAFGLRSAMIGVAALGLAFAILCIPFRRVWIQRTNPTITTTNS
jgi:predicted MFS family arabinose efflux permease